MNWGEMGLESCAARFFEKRRFIGGLAVDDNIIFFEKEGKNDNFEVVMNNLLQTVRKYDNQYKRPDSVNSTRGFCPFKAIQEEFEDFDSEDGDNLLSIMDFC